MNRCVIIAGADINNYENAKKYLKDGDFIICCDCGFRHLQKLNVKPNLIVGDFDSHKNPHLPVETIVLPCEKDDTDTGFAVKEALKRGANDFLFLGVIGNRFDHSFANISILLMLDTLGKSALAIDDFSELQIISSQKAFISDEFSFFSLLNVSGTAEGISIKNAKYPLENAIIKSEDQYGISNQVLPNQIAEVSIQKGRLLLIRVK
ncbi:MAG: thiamine diphosphokinase [Treponema sp.]|nr:thiamine diphosphokinase [Treponema sp.]